MLFVVISAYPYVFIEVGIPRLYWDIIINCWLPVIFVDRFQGVFFAYFNNRRFLKKPYGFKLPEQK